MLFNDLFKKNLIIHIHNHEKKYLHYFFGLNSLLHYLSNIYSIQIYFHSKVDDFENDLLQITIPSNIELNIVKKKNNDNFDQNYFLKKNVNKKNHKNQNQNLENYEYLHSIKIENYDLNNNILKTIDFYKVNNIESLFEDIFNIPYSIRFSNKNLLKRCLNSENNLYKYHLKKFNNQPYIFCSSFYHLNDSPHAIFIFFYNFYKKNLDIDNAFYDSWYNNNDPFYFYGKIIENAEEIYIHFQDIEWFELFIHLDLTHVSKKSIYYHSHHLEDLNLKKKNNLFLYDWDFILLE